MVTIQLNMQVPDDLAALFSRNLTLRPQPPPDPKLEPQIAYPISQHYHHSSHLVKKEEDNNDRQQEQQQQQQQQRPSSLPPLESGPTAEQVLTAHGVDPTVLSYAQMQLFKTADDTQKLRLLELWRICPPAPNNHHENPAIAWNTTTVEQEEQLAKMRYERQQQDELARKQQSEFEAQRNDWRNAQANESMSLDGTLVPIQGGDGRWITLSNSQAEDTPEPYMVSGYEQMAQRKYEASSRPKDVYGHFGTAIGGPNNARDYNPSTDPVYRQVMENQYGAFQMRGTCGIQADEMEVL
ncbi:hypothetical protein MKZ38_009196 [Zalerion maritima]|uniref:Uncharacterized protein n=1 Tax=Zalerion maritima TaxID=339359 RepID=A0AAD5RGQ7_9PEZI|nr:hypothetical protein MKZ38_009196 [Zalerion maritima]